VKYCEVLPSVDEITIGVSGRLARCVWHLRRVIKAVMSESRSHDVVVLEEAFSDLDLIGFAREEWGRQSALGVHGDMGQWDGLDIMCCAKRALMWKPAPLLLDLLQTFWNGGGKGGGKGVGEGDSEGGGVSSGKRGGKGGEEGGENNGGGGGETATAATTDALKDSLTEGKFPVAFHLRTYDLDEEECRYPYVPPPPEESQEGQMGGGHTTGGRGGDNGNGNGDGDGNGEGFFPDWNAVDASLRRCAKSNGRAAELRGNPPVSALIAAAAAFQSSQAPHPTPLYIFTDSRAAQGLIATGRGPHNTTVACSTLSFEYPTKHFYFTESDVLDLWVAAQAEVIVQLTGSTFTNLAICLARQPKVLRLHELARLVTSRKDPLTTDWV